MDDKLTEAIKVLAAAGAVISLPSQRHLGLGSAAHELDCCKNWLRANIHEFPNAWRMPSSGELRIPAGDVAEAKARKANGALRIPVRDIEALAKRCKLRREVES